MALSQVSQVASLARGMDAPAGRTESIIANTARLTPSPTVTSCRRQKDEHS